MKKINKIILIIMPVIILATPYEEFKANMHKQDNVPKKIKDFRKFCIQTIDRRKKILGKELKDKKIQEKIKKIKKCVNTKTTEQEINNCIPSIFRAF